MTAAPRAAVIDLPADLAQGPAMFRALLPLLLALLAVLSAAAADAACYADYKAKRDDPLRLHYGVIELPDAACVEPARARDLIAQRLQQAGWQLLSVQDTFGAGGLEQRRQSAGEYFLRF